MSEKQFSSFVPSLILSTTVLVLCIWQLTTTLQVRTNQEAVIKNQQPAVERSQKIQDEASAILGDLIELAKTDAQAAAVCQKHQIRRNE